MTSDERHLLEPLAASVNGCNDSHLLAHGFSPDLIVRMVRTRLATAKVEGSFAGGRAIEVTRVRITESDRRALVERRPERFRGIPLMRRPFRRWIAEPQIRRVMLGGSMRMAIHAADTKGKVGSRLG
jgi:hypothetical protein